MSVADHRSAAAREAASHYLGRLDELPGISAADLEAGLAAGRIVLLDVRPLTEYAAGHIPGAHHINPHRLAESLDEVLPQLRDQPSGTQIVAYCRGPYCAFAPQALRALTAHGIPGLLLADGLHTWKYSGRPVTHSNTDVA
jgi:rhodanese-related sulfurtransferase